MYRLPHTVTGSCRRLEPVALFSRKAGASVGAKA
jgi:hypothetical protein